MRVACILLKKTDSLLTLAEACLRFSPKVAMGDRCIFIEIGACKKLYSEKTFLMRAQILLKKFSAIGKVGIENDIPTARAMAQYNGFQKQQLPIEALSIYINPFQSVPDYEPTIETMQKLGIDSLQKLQKLPRRVLAFRFGKPVLLGLDQLDTANNLPWPIFTPSEKVIESLDISDQQIQDVERLSFVLKRILDRIVYRLKGQGKAISSLDITLSFEKMHPLR